MTLMHIPLEEIQESHLRELIDAGVVESLHIDYKRDTYGTNDECKAEFLADVSSFANASGGDIVIGINEDRGVPHSFAPFKGDAEAEGIKLGQIARSGLQPRVSNLLIRSVPVNGGCVLVVRVPRSYNGPHRIVFKNKNRFCSRSSGGKFDPDVDELRAMFTFAPRLTEQIESLRADRVSKISSGQIPVKLSPGIQLVVHIVPFSSFNTRQTLDIIKANQNRDLFVPLGCDDRGESFVNFDGILVLSGYLRDDKKQKAYTQVFRSGIIEAVMAFEPGDGNRRIVSANYIEHFVVRATKNYLSALGTLDIKPPFAILISLLGVNGAIIRTGDNYADSERPNVRIPHDQLHFVEAVFESIPVDLKECGQTLRPVLEQLANTAGLASSPSFDDSGKWKER